MLPYDTPSRVPWYAGGIEATPAAAAVVDRSVFGLAGSCDVVGIVLLSNNWRRRTLGCGAIVHSP